MNNKVIETIKNRRSIRNYKEEQITEEELETILEAALQAPTASNKQPWYFTVIQNRNLIDNMSDKAKDMMKKSSNEKAIKFGKSPTNIFYNAPTVIIVSGQKDVNSALVDCSAAIENMLLAAESIGLGTVWVGLVRFLFALDEEIEKFNLPDGYEPFYAVAVGYKDDNCVLGPSKRREDVINYIK